MFFLIRFDTWGGDVEFYHEFHLDTDDVDKETKLYYMMSYNILVAELSTRQLDNKDMIHRDLKNSHVSHYA